MSSLLDLIMNFGSYTKCGAWLWDKSTRLIFPLQDEWEVVTWPTTVYPFPSLLFASPCAPVAPDIFFFLQCSLWLSSSVLISYQTISLHASMMHSGRWYGAPSLLPPLLRLLLPFGRRERRGTLEWLSSGRERHGPFICISNLIATFQPCPSLKWPMVATKAGVPSHFTDCSLGRLLLCIDPLCCSINSDILKICTHFLVNLLMIYF